jgi:hypothetical protein
MTMSESTLQMMLAKDPAFLNRLNYLMLQTARTVKEEPADTPYHYKRTTYASQVLSNSALMVSQAASTVVGGINLIGTVELNDDGVTTTASDAAILSQVSTFWNALSSVDTMDDPNQQPPTYPFPPQNLVGTGITVPTARVPEETNGPATVKPTSKVRTEPR